MNKKTLIIIIAILAVVLIAGIAAIFLLPDPAAPNTGDDIVASQPTDQETGEPAQEDTPAAPSDVVQDPTEETVPLETAGEDVKDPTKPTNDPAVSDPTNPKPTAPRPTEPEETEPEKPYFPEATGTSTPEKDEITYLEYHAMSATEQKAFINTFESYDAFFDWHDAAKKAYEDSLIEIDGSTPVDMEDFAGGN